MSAAAQWKRIRYGDKTSEHIIGNNKKKNLSDGKNFPFFYVHVYYVYYIRYDDIRF